MTEATVPLEVCSITFFVLMQLSLLNIFPLSFRPGDTIPQSESQLAFYDGSHFLSSQICLLAGSGRAICEAWSKHP